jgi:hypothetical protein
MTYPNQPQQDQYQGGYPQQPGYPPNVQPPYPPAPPQAPYPQQPYYPQQQPQYPAQGGYPQQAPPSQQAPPAPVRRGSLADVMNQAPTGEGKSINTFLHGEQGRPVPLGQTFVGTVARALTPVDTFLEDRPNFDGREKWGLRIPFFTYLAAFTDGSGAPGRATWNCRGADLTILNNAMADAGVPLTVLDEKGAQGRVPEEGATISITWTGDTPMNVPGKVLNPRHDHRIIYQRPGTANGPAPQTQMQQWQSAPPQQIPGMEAAPQQPPANVVTPQWQQPQQQAPQYPARPAAQQVAQMAAAPQPQPVAGPPAPLPPQPPAAPSPVPPPQVPQPVAPQAPAPPQGPPPQPLPPGLPQTIESAQQFASVIAGPVLMPDGVTVVQPG